MNLRKDHYAFRSKVFCWGRESDGGLIREGEVAVVFTALANIGYFFVIAILCGGAPSLSKTRQVCSPMVICVLSIVSY